MNSRPFLSRPGTLLCALALCHLASAAAAAEVPAAGPRCRGEAAAPARLQLQLGKSSMLHLPEAVASRSVGNPAVLQAMLVAPDTLYLLGVDIGSTNMLIQGSSGVCSAIDVVVGIDTAALQGALAALLPDEKNIRVSAAADAVVLSGTVADASALGRALELASAYVRRPAQALPVAAHTAEEGKAPATAGAAAPAASGVRVVNFLDVAAPQQVMLEVKIAEVSKTLIDQLEVGALIKGSIGSWSTTLVSNFITGTALGVATASKSNGTQLTLAAQKKDGLVRILAEPTVMAISGQEGSFLAGGKIFIPVAQDNNKVTLEEKEYGVGLRFTPTVLAGGRINLRVAPEVSELSRDGIGITTSGVSGSAVLPLITTRRAATTVQLFDGQSFAIGGLIKNNQVGTVTSLPVLGQLPVLGALFRSTDFQQDRSELLFVVTPHLVKPLPAGYALPTDAGAAVSAPPSTAAPTRLPSPPPVPAGFELK